MGEEALSKEGPAPRPSPRSGLPDRRRHPRVPLSGSSSAEYVEGVLSVFGWGRRGEATRVLDLFQGGARLATRDPLDPGSVLRIRLRVERAEEEIELYGESRWSSRTNENPPQFQSGLMFFNATEKDSHQRLARLLSRLQDPLA